MKKDITSNNEIDLSLTEKLTASIAIKICHSVIANNPLRKLRTLEN